MCVKPFTPIVLLKIGSLYCRKSSVNLVPMEYVQP